MTNVWHQNKELIQITCLVALELGAAATASLIVVKFPLPSFATTRLNLVSFTEVCSNFLSFEVNHEGNPSFIFPYSGKISDLDEFFTPGTFFSMASELLT